MPGFSIDLSQGSPRVLHVRGDLDMANAEEFDSALEHAMSADPTVVIDMAGVTFIDGAAMRVILRAAESRNGVGPLTLVNASRVESLFDLVGLEEIDSIHFANGGDGHVR
jgi:anti-anti-sigma factor